MPNNAKVSIYNNLPGLYPEKFKVYIAPGNNQRTWKASNDISGNIFSQTVPRYSRPQTNLSVDSTYNKCLRTRTPCSITQNGTYATVKNNRYHGSLNPLKQWRRQLAPAGGSSSNRASVSLAMDYPGGATHLERLTATDCSSCGPLLTNYLKENPASNDCSNCPAVIRNQLSNFQPVNIFNPQRITRPRSSQTILKKNYYTTGAAYLRSRVKLHSQNQLLSAIPGNTYAPAGSGAGPGHDPSTYVPPSNSITGSQSFNSTYCISDPSACCSTSLDGSFCAVNVTYKPSNPVFSVQGAVSSGTRILDIKRKTIITNNTDFYSPNGSKASLTVDGQVLPGSTPIIYRGNTVAPYFIKSKYQQIDQCNPSGYKLSTYSKTRLDGRMPSGGTGIKTVCFPTLLK